MYNRSWKELMGLSTHIRDLTEEGGGPDVDISVSVVGVVGPSCKNGAGSEGGWRPLLGGVV